MITGFVSVSALLALVPTSSSAADEVGCRNPTIQSEPLAGGLARVSVQSPCYKGQFGVAEYGSVIFIGTFDASGTWQFVIDGFLGGQEVKFSFGPVTVKQKLDFGNLDQLTKVAIVWSDRIDLDLHAFEYVSTLASSDHRHAGSPGSYADAQRTGGSTGRAHGYLSATSNGSLVGTNFETYTLVHHARGGRGTIKLAIDFASRGDVASGDYCGEGTYAQPKFAVYVLSRGKAIERHDRELAALPCGERVPADRRLVSKLVPDINLGR